MTMVERITEAMDGAADDWALGTDNQAWECPYPILALAALKAMREPSMWMCMAHGAKPWDDWSAYDLWQAMIDRADSPSIEDEHAATAIGNRRA